MSPPTDPRVRRTRALVIDTVLALLAERGVAGTTVEAVAERSGVAKTTIYRHWDGQAALVLDAFAGVRSPPADPDTGTLRGDLLALVTGLAAAVSRGPAAGLWFALVDAAERDPRLRELHHREAETRHGVILRIVERAVARGELPRGTDPAEVLDLLAGPVFYRRATRGDVDRRFAERLVDRVLGAYTR
ncbi:MULTISPECIES: TetR/AcrR family transcriptional regulator [unclassified Micromonospora]|uniref:TetR/AcrR family transcriptional regulator n=1 Tax=unclassified Micromonospora TaxID=2617518 RepID=UPI001C22DE48|nr:MULTISPECIES: TetR/AcrR family transcriptional regulator [unclassified Micromonospora]MBU8861676.1 TetR/AcrR family transcriptional regulator [Micromonospora sp. WMMB482]MDM4781245.1 TetR/AcrR family transcriptional regulator [Micromonospora sp. b486]